MKSSLLLVALGMLAACSPKPSSPTKAGGPASGPAPITAPAGDYVVDRDHTSLNFRISHLGFSHYTARFLGVDEKVRFDPAHPAQQTVEAVINARSLQTNYVGPPKLDFDAQIEKEFLHADEHPQITFRSTKVELTGPRAARVTGDLTLNGVTKPVTLQAAFNGGYPKNSMDPKGARIGFSVHGTLKRSDFGITYGLPAPGTDFGVGDEIEVIIETELNQASG